ncbi:HDOD domain-containing protein [Colwellia sp. MEBiC06753]
MVKQTPTPKHWIELISQQELPALTSTAKLLDKFANDDVSSLPMLSRAILNDQALTTCLLKVANSVPRMGVNKITTVSRATVVLGIHTVKNICLTSKVIDSLIKHKKLELSVYNKIKRLMATSFYAGQLAKMMLPEYNDDTKEEVYLAAMLRRIGETAFWCLDEEFNLDLSNLVNLPKSKYSQTCKELLGMSFDELSVGLAKQWNLSDLLIKSLDHPENRTKEMQVIYLADKLAQFIDSPPTANEFDELIKQITDLMGVNERQLFHRIKHTQNKSIELISSYGAQMLSEYIKGLPTQAQLEQESSTINEVVNKDAAQLQAIQQLTTMAFDKSDINQFLEYTLKQINHILSFDFSSFYLLSSDKQQMICRYRFNRSGDNVYNRTIIPLVNADNLFIQLLSNQGTKLINSDEALKQANLTGPTYQLFQQGKLAIAKVAIEHKTIGFIIAERTSEKMITDNDFNKFCFFIQHLNMCLTMTSGRK